MPDFPSFTSLSDIWKSFWQALEEELLALGGRVEMLQRLAKKDLRPAIRQLAKAIVGLAAVSDSDPGPVFDLERAKKIWSSASSWKNPNLLYCTFTWQNQLNSTRLEVRISYCSRTVQIELDLCKLDCPRLGSGREKPHQLLMHLNLNSKVVKEVIYHEENKETGQKNGIEFVIKPLPEWRFRNLTIFDTGYVVFSLWP